VKALRIGASSLLRRKLTIGAIAASLLTVGAAEALGAWSTEGQLPRHFETPSGNIFCAYSFGQGSSLVGCVIKSGWNPPLPRRGQGCSRSYWVDLFTTGRVRPGGSVCAGEDDPEGPYIGIENAWVLSYGRTWSGGGIRCTSAVTGLTCRNKSNHGFFLSRERWRKF
jgi:hypothetical protein